MMAFEGRGCFLFVFFLLLCPAVAPPWYGRVGRWRDVISLCRSLLLKVARARSERGDTGGAATVRALADKLGFLGGGTSAAGGLWSLFWDYLRNYAWREGGGLGSFESTAEIYVAAGEMISSIRQYGQLRSDAERAQWVARNYSKMVSAARTIFRRLSATFWRWGALREMVVVLQKEVVDGDLVRDCLRVGAEDLEALIVVARDLFFSSSTDSFTDSEYDL